MNVTNRVCVRRVVLICLAVAGAIACFVLSGKAFVWGKATYGPTTDFSGMWVSSYSADGARYDRLVLLTTKMKSGEIGTGEFIQLLQQEPETRVKKLHFVNGRRFCGLMNKGNAILVFCPPGMCWAQPLKANRTLNNCNLTQSDCVTRGVPPID